MFNRKFSHSLSLILIKYSTAIRNARKKVTTFIIFYNKCLIQTIKFWISNFKTKTFLTTITKKFDAVYLPRKFHTSKIIVVNLETVNTWQKIPTIVVMDSNKICIKKLIDKITPSKFCNTEYSQNKFKTSMRIFNSMKSFFVEAISITTEFISQLNKFLKVFTTNQK